MKRQINSHYCGVASIANALEVLGIRRSQREIARLCDVRPEVGTDETELKRALLGNRVDVDEWLHKEDENSRAWLYSHLFGSGPVVLCLDESDHWSTAIGVCKDKFLVFDPARDCGVEVHSWDTLRFRWRDTEDGFYGVGVSLP